MTVCLPICFEERVSLSPEERQAVEKLIEECRAVDRFDPCMEFDTHLNAHRDLPAWRLAWAVPSGTASCSAVVKTVEETAASPRILAGAACVFAPGRSEGEISACVSPVFRHQGIFRELYSNLAETLFRSGAGSVLLVCEGAAPSGATIAARLGAVLDHGEYLMSLPADRLSVIQTPGDMRLVPVFTMDLDEFVSLSEEVFTERHDDAREFALAILADPDREQFIARGSGGVFGLVALAREDGRYMLHGLGVVPALRGKGLGGAILDAVLIVLRNRGATDISLEVDVDNPAALALYRSRGFNEMSRADYWRIRGPRSTDQP
jgi:mycothiol synthase